MKRQLRLNSYDEVIRKLFKSRTGQPESLFGSCKDSHSFVRKREDEHTV
jgi:hypothetical protein